jgi:N-acetylneuraminate synthase
MSKIFIIAEAGVNHNGSIDYAKKLIDVAAAAGADAVKFQTFKTDKLVSRNAPKADYQLKATNNTETQYEMLKKLELNERAHEEIVSYCKQKNIQFISTPFDMESVDYLNDAINIPLFKIPSAEITNGPFLLKIARKGKPIILSTGMSTLGEIEMALGVLACGYLNLELAPSFEAFQSAYLSEKGQAALKQNVTLLHCTTEYPAPLSEVNLNNIKTLKRAFGLKVGYSDHTMGIAIPIATAAMGVSVIEKHFTLDKTLPGPDHKASLEPEELVQMVEAIREVERAMGTFVKGPTFSETKNKKIARKSLVAAKNIKAGEVFTSDNLTCKRPGDGIEPMLYWDYLGRKADKNYQNDEQIKWRK